jgi:hypothetical protein
MTHLRKNGTTVDIVDGQPIATYPCGHVYGLVVAPRDQATAAGFFRGWWRCPHRCA